MQFYGACLIWWEVQTLVDHMGFLSDPTRPEKERELEFPSVVSSARDAAEATRADFGVAAIQSVPGVDPARSAR